MKQNKWKTVTCILLLVTLVIAGVIAIAAEYGTSDDPLVSLSYINNVLAPQISQKVDEIIAEKTASLGPEIDAKINSASGEVDNKLSQYASQQTDVVVDDAFVANVANKVAEKVGGATPTFTLVKLNAGQTITGKVGMEALLRLGDATCVSSGTPGLIDMTTGGDLAGGKALEKNHLYLCTIDGRGIRATSNATLLVRGPYSIS